MMNPSMTTPFRESLRSGATVALTAALGHAAVFAVIALIYGSAIGGHDDWRGAPAIAIGAFLSWLLLVGRRIMAPLWLFLIAGFMTVALSVLLVVIATITVAMGYLDGWLAFLMAMNVLPFALLGGGVVAAVVSLLYGLALRQLMIRSRQNRNLKGA